jgi:acyl-coenzyme A synthetase/AMP-(fatty) acid ligase/3-hydroxymyristoyl/3-hydroxydecanoyl-(acyl carrier protein) dehydratase
MSGVNTMHEVIPVFIDLLTLPHYHRSATHVVGWRDGKAISNAVFSADVQRWQQHLQQHPGRRFALYLNDTLDFAAALLGAWQAGKIVYLPSDALPQTCATLAAEVDGFIGEVDAQWQPLQAAALPACLPVAAAPTALPGDFAGLVVYTSGSTGTAQAIPKKLVQLTQEVGTLEQLFGARLHTSEVVATVSHQHIYGLLFKVLWPLAAGRAIHACSAFFPEQLAAIAPTARPWLLLSSPAHLKRLPASQIQADISGLRAVFSSGGPLLQEVSLTAQHMFRQIPIEIYGSSETGGIAWRQIAPAADDIRDDSWQPMPQVEVRASDQDDCLEVRSPHLQDNAWLRMADRISMVNAATPRFLLRGRADRIVKLEEKRISLDQIERLLLATPWVAEVRVLMHPGQDQHARDRIAAFVVPSSSGQQQLEQAGKLALNQQLRAHLAGAIEHVALPRQWRYLPALPTNAQGKTASAALLALLEPASLPATDTEIRMTVSTPPAAPLLPQSSLQQQDETQVTLALHVPHDLLYFQGHFNDAPILPGVVQLDWALTLARRYFDLPPHCLGMQALKFQQVIRPGADIMLELQHDADKNALAFRLHSAAGQHASGRILLGQH